MSVGPDVGALRAGDADREAVAEQLRTAYGEGRITGEELDQRLMAAMTARTIGELWPLTADLFAPAVPPPARTRDAPVTAVLSRTVRLGRFVLAQRTPVTVAGGRLVLDLTEALVQHKHVVVDARIIGGVLRLIVPDGVEVRLTPAMYAASPRVARRPPCGPDAPCVTVEGTVVLGRVEVRRPPRRWRR